MAYNALSTSRRFLKRHRKSPPSMIIHVHPGFVKIENTNGVFLSDGPVRQLVDAVFSERLRADMIEALEKAGVQYYDGQLVVEVHEYRKGPRDHAAGLLDSMAAPPSAKPSAASLAATSGKRAGRTYTPSQHTLAASTSGLKPPGSAGLHGAKEPNKYRVALTRSSQALWTELGLLFADAGITQEQAVALEGRILTITTPPLCLDPSFEVSRIANHMLNKTMTAERPQPPRRKANQVENADEVNQEEELDRAQERERLLYGDPVHSAPKAFTPSFGRYNYIVQWRTDRENLKTHPTPVDPHTASASSSQPAVSTAAASTRSQPGIPSQPSVASLPKIQKAKVPPKRDAPSPAPSASKVPPAKRKKVAPRGDFPSQSEGPRFANQWK